MIEKAPYLWQQDAWQNWQQQLSQKKVPHAILLHGQVGCGLHDFSLRLCYSLLCDCNNNTNDVEIPCWECDACRLFSTGNHPDCLIIEAEQEQIKIEQVRQAIDFLQLSRHYLSYKVVLLKEVDKLNYAAANSLLKTLEEPPLASVILMACRQPSTLPATILSRCHRIYLRVATEKENETPDNEDKSLFYEELEQWMAKQTATHELVEHWHDKPAVEIQQWLLEYLQHAILTNMKETSINDMTSSDKHKFAKLLYWLYQRQIERCRLAKQNINPQLLLEGSLLEWRKAHRSN